jgi:hypothetical protein
MKKILIALFSLFIFADLQAQCSICTKTASQLGEGPAEGLNFGILYLMLTPLALIAFIGYKWWRRERQIRE